MTNEPRATLIKCRPDQDFYVAWSDVTESPHYAGTEAEMRQIGYTQQRVNRAKETGTSSLPGFYRWNTTTLIAEQRGVLPRRYLRAYALLYAADELQAAFDLLEPFEDGEEVRRG